MVREFRICGKQGANLGQICGRRSKPVEVKVSRNASDASSSLQVGVWSSFEHVFPG